MFYLDCTKPFDKDSNNFKHISLPVNIEADKLCAMSYDGNFIVMFDKTLQDAWSLDIGHDNNQWVKSKLGFRKLKQYYNALYVVVGKDNYAYFFNTYPRDDLFCVKISLNDIIPKEILKRYSKPLVYGFVREQAPGTSIPIEIVELLFTFCQ